MSAYAFSKSSFEVSLVVSAVTASLICSYSRTISASSHPSGSEPRRVRGGLQRQIGAGEQRVEIELAKLGVVERPHDQAVPVGHRPVLDIPEDEVVRARAFPERLALVPRQEDEEVLVLEPVEIEIVGPVVAGNPVLIGEEDLDRDVLEELLEIEKLLHRRAPDRVARLVRRPEQPLEHLALRIVFERLRLERQRRVQRRHPSPG